MLSARALRVQNMTVRAVRREAHGALDAEYNFSLITNSSKKQKTKTNWKRKGVQVPERKNEEEPVE